MTRLAVASICLTALFALHLSEAVPSESKARTLGNGKTAIDKKDLVDLVKRESKANLEKSVKGYKFDINRLSDKETERMLVSSYVRNKRQSAWGSCQPVCQHRCLPTCNLLCCLTTPFVVPKKTVKMIEKQLALKKLKKKSKISKKHSKKAGKVCEPNCRKRCLPSCKFSCCFTPKKH